MLTGGDRGHRLAVARRGFARPVEVNTFALSRSQARSRAQAARSAASRVNSARVLVNTSVITVAAVIDLVFDQPKTFAAFGAGLDRITTIRRGGAPGRMRRVQRREPTDRREARAARPRAP